MKIKKIVDRVKQSKEGKVLISNFAYLSLLQVAGYVFPLLTMPYLARVIGVEGYGKIAFAAAIMVWIQTIADWGFNYTATRDVARNRDDKEKVSDIFSRILWSRCLLMILSFVVLVLLIACVPKFRENETVILVTFLMIPGHIMFPDWFFQAMERMKYITVLNILSKFLFTVLVFVFIKEKDDYILQPLFLSLGFILAGIISMYYIVVKWKIVLRMVSFKTILHTIKSSTDVFINNLMPNLYNSFSTVLLGFIGGDVANGKLDVGSKFVNIFQQFMNVLSRTFYPFLSRRISKHSFYAKINITFAIIISIALFCVAPLLIELFFTEEFTDSTIVLQIMSVSIFFMALNNIYGTNYMLIQGLEKELRKITTLCSIIGFLLSFPLIYFFEYVGAAVIITITRGLLGICTMVYVKSKGRLVIR